MKGANMVKSCHCELKKYYAFEHDGEYADEYADEYAEMIAELEDEYRD